MDCQRSSTSCCQRASLGVWVSVSPSSRQRTTGSPSDQTAHSMGTGAGPAPLRDGLPPPSKTHAGKATQASSTTAAVERDSSTREGDSRTTSPTMSAGSSRAGAGAWRGAPAPVGATPFSSVRDEWERARERKKPAARSPRAAAAKTYHGGSRLAAGLDTRRAPHSAQNRAPSGFSLRHLRQTMPFPSSDSRI